MQPDQAPTSTFQPYELGQNHQLIRLTREKAREGMNRHGLTLLARWGLMTTTLMTASALVPTAPLQLALFTAAGGFLQRWASSGILHDASHGVLLRDRRMNDAVGRTVAGLVLIDFREFQRKHLAHHKFLATALDPEDRDMSAYGFDRRGMTMAQILAMYARVHAPDKLMANARASLTALRTNPWPLAIAMMALLPFAFLGAPLALVALGWLLGSILVRPLLWLIANSTEHDPVLQHEIDTRSTPRGARLAGMSKEFQWLAVSRERRGLLFWITCPESERLYHGDHHAAASIPGGALADYVAARQRFDPLCKSERRITHGLFFGRHGYPPALGALLTAAARRRDEPRECPGCTAFANA
jgi:fatty acid desaturase